MALYPTSPVWVPSWLSAWTLAREHFNLPHLSCDACNHYIMPGACPQYASRRCPWQRVSLHQCGWRHGLLFGHHHVSSSPEYTALPYDTYNACHITHAMPGVRLLYITCASTKLMRLLCRRAESSEPSTTHPVSKIKPDAVAVRVCRDRKAKQHMLEDLLQPSGRRVGPMAAKKLLGLLLAEDPHIPMEDFAR